MKEIIQVLPKLNYRPCITIVALISPMDKKMALGFAVRDEDDDWDEDRGHDIAAGRAAKAMVEKKGRFFKRQDVMADFALCGLNVKGAKKIPKSMYLEGKPMMLPKLFFKNRQLVKRLGVA